MEGYTALSPFSFGILHDETDLIMLYSLTWLQNGLDISFAQT